MSGLDIAGNSKPGSRGLAALALGQTLPTGKNLGGYVSRPTD